MFMVVSVHVCVHHGVDNNEIIYDINCWNNRKYPLAANLINQCNLAQVFETDLYSLELDINLV